MIPGIPGREGTVEDVLTGDRRKVGGRRHQRERERSSTTKFPEVRLCVNIRNCSGISLITLFGKITGHRTMTDANGVSSSFRSQLVSAGADTWVQSAFSVDARHCMCGGAVLCCALWQTANHCLCDSPWQRRCEQMNCASPRAFCASASNTPRDSSSAVFFSLPRHPHSHPCHIHCR